MGWSTRAFTGVRGALVLVLGTALAVGTVVPGAAAPRTLGDPPVASADDGCDAVAETADASVAAALATRCDTDVEVLSERTEWSTTYAQPDGTTRLDLSAAAVRTQQDGAWVDVDSSVVPGVDGLRVAAPVTAMTFSDGTDGQPLVRMERDGHELTFDVPFALPEPAVDGSQLTYDEVLPGVDLVVTVNPDATGFSEVLRVESPEAAADPRLQEIAFPVVVSDGLDVVEDDGGFAARDAGGEEVFTSPTPAMWDSADAPVVTLPAFALPGGRRPAPARTVGVQRAPDTDGGDRAVAPLGGESVAWMPAEVTGDEVVVVPDAEMLTSPDTVWPVHIDPSVSGSLNSWTAVRSAYGPDFGFNPDQGVGLCNRATSTTCPTTFASRVLWRFAGLEAIGAIDPSEVVSATFSAVGTHSYSCTPQPVTLYWTADFTSTTPWPGGGLWNPQSTQVVAHKAACADSPVRWIEFGATGAAQAVAQYDASVLAVGLAADESTMAAWKRYRYDARLSIELNRTPTPPTRVRTTEPDSGCAIGAARPSIRSATPVLRATLADPDGENLRSVFEMHVTSPLAELWSSGWSAPQVSGADQAVRVPAGLLKDGQTYSWRVRSQDTSGRLSAYGFCEFTVDVTRPAVPGVAAVAPAPAGRAAYVEDGAAGGIGVPGSFTLSSAGSGDVVGYRYAFGSSGMGPVVPGASIVVPFMPDTAGPHTLRVTSVDAAGNVSDERLYRFTVDFAADGARWMLDEPDGTTTAAANVAGAALTVTASTGRGPGVRAEVGGRATDRALVFDSVQDVATSSGPMISATGSFSVMAFVRLDPGATSGSATAVSQDGTATSGFELGVREDTACPAGTARCFAFWRQATDSGTAAAVVARSSVPVEPGAWYQLTGTQSAGDRTLQVSVCKLGTADAPVEEPDPVPGTAAAFTTTWSADGPLRLGQARSGSTPVRAWPGSVSDVRLSYGVLDTRTIFNACLAG
ncbi:LamG-like jellyroll fold domain-containing protein [Cellulomonas sp. NPDC055163]